MKIAINSPCFLPRIGGLENVTAMLAGHFAKRGHEVRVLTITPVDEKGEPDLGFQIVRDPRGERLWETARWCDVFVHSNMSLKAVHPLLLLRKPWVAIHHGWYSDLDKPMTWNAMAKRRLARFASANVAVSGAVAKYVDVKCEVIPNPYDEIVFHEYSDVVRDRDLIFVGRLVSDKGASLLVDAISRLEERGLHPTVTITGSGPEAEPLRHQVESSGLGDLVSFSGSLTGESLARKMNAHRVIVIPSVWHEPFGIVALEGIGCGCVAVGSSGGGLPEAIGPCGLVFPNNDVAALADVLAGLLTGRVPMEPLLNARERHLKRHTLAAVGDAYLHLFQAAASTP